MAKTNVYEKNAPAIQKRFVIQGTLELTSPAALTNGDDGNTDMPLRRDEQSGRPLLPGTTLAGALRSYLNIRLADEESAYPPRLINKLFGHQTGQQSNQSWLFVDDSLGTETAVEIRDGVAIDSETRVAADDQKFDLELLAAGTCFEISLEFWQPAGSDGEPLTQILAVALQALTAGEIHFGVRKRRGFGACQVKDWQVTIYDMAQPADIIAWLENATTPQGAGSLADKLHTTLPHIPSLSRCRLTAVFNIDGSILIRATPPATADENGPDAIHLQNAKGEPVLSGTSVAGVLRSQAERILNTLHPDDPQVVTAFVNDLFGPRMGRGENVTPRASRIWVKETVIENSIPVIQPRVRIDRFTGGSYQTALFSNEPVFGGQATLNLEIDHPTAADVGMLLLLLKDLWTGFMPVGGESSVGCGRLQGIRAELSWQGKTWQFAQDPANGKLLISLAGDGSAEALDPLKTAVSALQQITIPVSDKEASA